MIWIIRHLIAKKLHRWIDVYVAPMPRIIVKHQYDDVQMRIMKKRVIKKLRESMRSES